MTVKVRFIIFPFLLPSNYSHQYVNLDAPNAQMVREFAFLARKVSPKMEVTKRSVIYRRLRLRQQREDHVQTDRTLLEHNVPFVTRHAQRAMVHHQKTVPYVAPIYPCSKADVSLWALKGCVQKLLG